MSGTQAPASAPPPVGGGRPPLSGTSKVAIGVGGVAAVLVMFMLNQNGFQPKSADELGGTSAAGTMRRIELPGPERQETAQTISVANRQVGTTAMSSAARSKPIKPALVIAWEDRAGQGERGQPGASTAPADAGESGDDPLAARLRATRAEAAKARRLRDPDLTLTMGTIIPCSPQQPLNTQLPGFLSCVVPTEVRGQSGNVVLLDPGTRIVGQVQRSMQHGQDRAFVLWTRAETPDGVVVDLGSPGTDAMGQNGLDVEVHTNFWQRFGGAIMLSFLDAGLQMAAIGASNALSSGSGGNNVSFYQMQSGGRSAASTSLDATVNIPSYGTRGVGVPAAVFVAKDLDFSGVYRLRRASR